MNTPKNKLLRVALILLGISIIGAVIASYLPYNEVAILFGFLGAVCFIGFVVAIIDFTLQYLETE